MDEIRERETHGRSNHVDESTPADKVKGPNIFERAKEEIEALVEEIIHPRKESDHETGKEETQATTLKEKMHDKETHGANDDIDEDTPIDRVKGPNIFERAKEELEALVEAVHPKKEHEDK